MTRRLAIVISAVVVSTLVLAGLGTLAVGNLRARHLTENALRREAVDTVGRLDDVISEAADQGPAALRRTLRSLNLFRRALDLDGLAVLTTDGAGDGAPLAGADQLPASLGPERFPEADLRAGRVLSGHVGKLVYAAAPTTLPSGRLIVVVVSRDATSAQPAAWGTFLLAALATLALGIGAAVVLGRRLTRPIRDASAAATAIADGRLATRLAEPDPTATDELSELARSINGMAVELERARVLEQQFLLSVSHDLRTPLTSIRGYAEAISDGAADPQRSAAVIRSEARRLERLVADLLDLAKLRANGFSLHPERLDLTALATVAADAFAPDAAERQIAIRNQLTTAMTVFADHDRLAQVVANLLENALKFARTEVVVRTTAENGWAVLAIDDDGPGIAPEDLPHVFDRLYVARSQPARHESSSGLGLAIVKELVVAMGGSVTASRAPSGGARLAVHLPLAG